jgi:hypothetical protein
MIDWKIVLLAGLILAISGGAISAFDWRTLRITASYQGSLCACFAYSYPYHYQDLPQALSGDLFRVKFSAGEPESEILVAILDKDTLAQIVSRQSANESLQSLREKVKASAKIWAEGNSGIIDWAVDTPGRYGWIVVPYRGLVSQFGAWQITVKVLVEQSTQNLAIKHAGYVATALGLALTISGLGSWFTRKRSN